MKSFLTGSCAYGTPTVKSDIDVVVYMDDKKLIKLLLENGGHSSGDKNDMGGYSVSFGSLNIIICTTPQQYAAWQKGTNELIAKKPVTRDEAVEIFNKYRSKCLIP